MWCQSSALRDRLAPEKRIVRIPLATIASWSVAAQAETGAQRGANLPADPLSAGTLTQLVLGMVLVVGLILVSAWVLRRFNRFQSSASGQLRIVGGLSMGARERVVLVQVGARQLLLGVAPGRVQTLHVLEEPLETVTGTGTGCGDGFAQRLHSALRQGGGK
ncbi:MAG: flagellar biosynthetic protein FliO [Gammaproteobacteria bacterium]